MIQQKPTSINVKIPRMTLKNSTVWVHVDSSNRSDECKAQYASSLFM